ncbi:MAG: transcription elongation factor GreA [Pirellulaceae bacterium]|jgi:transcription elongation factor GreA|nr:transcription elongation factor GreA [Pirellulaceae bacterium]MDP6718163.1 transcription elongation factor GreA [Pirellulaceae bacterium]
MSQRVPMTQEGYNKKKADIDRMENVEMPLIAERIAAARDEGDLKENAEYHAQRENQGMLQAKINRLKSDLANGMIIDPATMPRGEVAFGATVKVKDLDFDDEEVYTLVGSGEEDYDTGRILLTSPIGQGLLGKKVGEVAEIKAPKGIFKLEVIEISYE